MYLNNENSNLYFFDDDKVSIIKSEKSYIEIITDENMLHLFSVSQQDKSIYIDYQDIYDEENPSLIHIQMKFPIY